MTTQTTLKGNAEAIAGWHQKRLAVKGMEQSISQGNDRAEALKWNSMQ